MKFGVTPLRHRQLIFWEDDVYFKENGLKYQIDVQSEIKGEWFRIYTNISVLPSYAKELCKIAKESIYFKNSNYQDKKDDSCNVDSISPIVTKKDIWECTVLTLNDGRILYYY